MLSSGIENDGLEVKGDKRDGLPQRLIIQTDDPHDVADDFSLFSPSSLSERSDDEKASPLVSSIANAKLAEQNWSDVVSPLLLDAFKSPNETKFALLLGPITNFARLQTMRDKNKARLEPLAFNIAANNAALKFLKWHEKKIYVGLLLKTYKLQDSSTDTWAARMDEGSLREDDSQAKFEASYREAIALEENDINASNVALDYLEVQIKKQLKELPQKPQAMTDIEYSAFKAGLTKYVNLVEAQLLLEFAKEKDKECSYFAKLKHQEFDEDGLHKLYHQPWVTFYKTKLLEWKNAFTRSYEAYASQKFFDWNKLFDSSASSLPKQNDYARESQQAYAKRVTETSQEEFKTVWNELDDLLKLKRYSYSTGEGTRNNFTTAFTTYLDQMRADALEGIKDKDKLTFMQHAMVFYRSRSAAERRALQPKVRMLFRYGFSTLVDDPEIINAFQFANREAKKSPLTYNEEHDLPDWFLVECEYESLKTLAPQTEKARSVIEKYAAENRALIEDVWYEQKWFGVFALIMFEQDIIEQRKKDLVDTARLFAHLGFVYQVPESIIDKLARLVLIRQRGLRNRSRLGEGLMPIFMAEDEGMEGSLAELLNEVALSHRVASDAQRQRIQNLHARLKIAEENVKLEKERTKNMPAMQAKLDVLEAEVKRLEAEIKNRDELIAAYKSKQQQSPVHHRGSLSGTPPSPGGGMHRPHHRASISGGNPAAMFRSPSPLSSTSSDSEVSHHSLPPRNGKAFNFKMPAGRRPSGIMTGGLFSPGATPVLSTPIPLSQTPLSSPQSARLPAPSPTRKGLTKV